MDTIPVLKSGFQLARMVVEGTMEGVTPEQAHWQPPQMAHTIAATYAHLVVGEDMLVNGVIGGAAPLAKSSWAGKTGVSALPPQGEDWADWARAVKVDLPALHQYAQAVYAATDAALDAAKPADLDRAITLPFEGLGTPPAAMVYGMCISHANNHAGEISAVKGLQGLKGYPF